MRHQESCPTPAGSSCDALKPSRKGRPCSWRAPGARPWVPSRAQPQCSEAPPAASGRTRQPPAPGPPARLPGTCGSPGTLQVARPRGQGLRVSPRRPGSAASSHCARGQLKGLRVAASHVFLLKLLPSPMERSRENQKTGTKPGRPDREPHPATHSFSPEHALCGTPVALGPPAQPSPAWAWSRLPHLRLITANPALRGTGT